MDKKLNKEDIIFKIVVWVTFFVVIYIIFSLFIYVYSYLSSKSKLELLCKDLKNKKEYHIEDIELKYESLGVGSLYKSQYYKDGVSDLVLPHRNSPFFQFVCVVSYDYEKNIIKNVDFRQTNF